MTRIVRLMDLRPGRGIVDHRDGGGHLAPEYETRLRDRAQESARRAIEKAFVRGPSTADASAELSGEEFLQAATSGEERGASDLDAVSSEERGGPFLVTTGRTEYAYDADASNPASATREPFPKT
ncbi:MAG: hypothetical protein ACRELB_12225 [Polyangiaceae bacterium]